MIYEHESYIDFVGSLSDCGPMAGPRDHGNESFNLFNDAV